MLPKLSPDNTLDPLYRDYLQQLRSSDFSGEIRIDYAARLAVATDNSIYQVIPQAVIFPRHTNDISIALKISHTEKFHLIKFAPRGGGTGTNGQSLSAGIIIDCSKYLHQILEVNLEEKWARVQPGVVLDQLNQYLKLLGVHFAPEISPSNRATIGGMVNTDACGNGSKILGRTSDHVVDLTCVLANGTIIHTDALHLSFEKELTHLLQKNQRLIHEKFFPAPRTLGGYNLAKAYAEELHLNYLFCGSEGTLGIISECKLKLSPLPKYKKLVVIKYRNFEDALRAREFSDATQPLVIETIDEKLIALAQQDSIYLQIKDFIEGANAVNLAEFVANNEEEIDLQISQLCKNIDSSEFAVGYYVAKNATEIKLLWELRKKSVGLISKRLDGTRRPIPFIEDTAVPPEKVADYIDEFKKLLDSHQLIYGMYGHVDAGCIHVRPALDTKLPQDEKLVREISDEVVALVKKYGGVIWGEHGKGYRSEYGPEFFGDELYAVLRQIKAWFDPYNQLNPGKIATPIDSTDEVVKLESNLRGQFDRQISADLQTQFTDAMTCNGNGACFNFSTQDVMCPSFKVTQDRIHSPKGRATVIREWLRLLSTTSTDVSDAVVPRLARGIQKPSQSAPLSLDPAGKPRDDERKDKSQDDGSRKGGRDKVDFSHEVFSALSGCLSCKACANQCPLNVDVPEFKAKFLERYYTRYRRPLRDYFIAHSETIAKWQAKFPKISNWLLTRKITKSLAKSVLKIADLPTLENKKDALHTSSDAEKNQLIILQDAFTSFYEPHILQSCYNLFTTLGFSVKIEPFFINGKPFHVKGFIKKFSSIAQKNIQRLRKLAEKNIPMIGIDPSITLTYRDEYQKLMGKENLGFTVQLPQEFLFSQLEKIEKKCTRQNSYFLLSHCTEKTTQTETEKQWRAIFSHFGANLTPLAAGCCGMAGSYGHELEHQENSLALFNMDWQKHLYEKTNAAQSILTTGYSCRSQAARFAKIKLQHPLEALLTIIKQETL